MEFWSEFIKESLYSPWLLKAVLESDAKPWVLHNHKVFVVEAGLDNEASEMLQKMIAALKYKQEEVTVLESQAQLEENLQNLSESKKILFFGNDFPGHFGEFQNWSGHRILQTHSVADLLRRPELKKQTWQHLKSYASLK